MCEQVPTQAWAHARALLQTWGEIHTLLGFQLHPWTHPRALLRTESKHLRATNSVPSHMPDAILEIGRVKTNIGPQQFPAS